MNRSAFGVPVTRYSSFGNNVNVVSVRASTSDGVTNSGLRHAGGNVGRGIAKDAATSPEFDDRGFAPDGEFRPRSQMGPLPGRAPIPDTPIQGVTGSGQHSAATAGAGWDGDPSAWPTDGWGASVRPAELLGLDPAVLDALLKAGKAAGTIAADVTPDLIAARRAKMEAKAARAQGGRASKQAKVEEAKAARAAASAEAARAKAAAAAAKGQSQLGGAILLGFSLVAAAGLVFWATRPPPPPPASKPRGS